MSTLDNPELEMLVDRQGLRIVLEMLAHICIEKADHVRSNWQDEHLARIWQANARAVHGACNKVTHS